MTAQKPWINRILFVLSLLGVIMAVYVLQSFMRQAPIVCVSGGCEIVRKHPASYPFGIPVPAFGLVGYTILTFCAFAQTLHLKKSIHILLSRIMLGVALFGASFVTWFTYTEITVIKGICMWCAISGVNMYIILWLLILKLKNERNTL